MNQTGKEIAHGIALGVIETAKETFVLISLVAGSPITPDEFAREVANSIIEILDTPKTNILTSDDQLIQKIVERATSGSYEDRIEPERLRKALLAAHRAKPIRLDDLLHTCNLDFFGDVFNGAYRHYDQETDSIKDGWTAKHSEPK